MAKKTAKKPAPKKAAPKKKPESKKKTKKAATPKKAAKPVAKPVLNDEQIGYAAGAVWVALNNGPMTLAAIKKAVDQPGETTLMAIGWLAREGKLEFSVSGRSIKISLRG